MNHARVNHRDNFGVDLFLKPFLLLFELLEVLLRLIDIVGIEVIRRPRFAEMAERRSAPFFNVQRGNDLRFLLGNPIVQFFKISHLAGRCRTILFEILHLMVQFF